MTAKILAFAGSARKDSFNKKLVKVAAAGAEAAGAEVTFIDMKEYSLPIFDQDLEAEEGLPENAKKLKQLFNEHDGLLISCPEYNGAITPLLKNVIDWVSRPSEGESMLAGFRGKAAVVMAASPGGLGGIRMLPGLRTILSGIGVTVLPDQFALGKAHEAFNDDGSMSDEKTHERVKGLGAALAQTLAKLQA